MKKRFKYLSVLFIVFIVAMAILNSLFYFNPLIFKQDRVTYLSWHWYSKPLTVEYLLLEDEWNYIKTEDSKEIRFVINELKKSPLVDDFNPSVSTNLEKLVIREVIIRNSQDTIVLRVRQVEDDIYLLKHNINSIKLTQKLLDHFNQRFSEIQNSIDD